MSAPLPPASTRVMNLAHFVTQARLRGPDDIALVWRDRTWSWAEFEARIDADGRIAQTYGLRGVPAFVIVDPAGQIRSVSLGYTTGWGLRARLWWAGLSS